MSIKNFKLVQNVLNIWYQRT